MKKIAVYIADQQDVRLKALASSLGVTQAELFRQCVEEGLARLEQALHARINSVERKRLRADTDPPH
jgi:predicted DNA-binding protein